MTASARISQQDIDRVLKGVARAGISNGRIVMDFTNRKIEVIIGEAAANAGSPGDDDFDDEDR